jgi:tetratricopeptide (TPR) repeat protein
VVEYFSKLGTVLVRGGEEDHGFLMLRRAVDMDPESVLAWGNLGAMQMRAGRYEEAFTSLRRARDLDPADGQIQYNLAVLHRRDGERTQAIDAYERALLTRPDLEEAWIGLARTLVEEGRYADARRVLREFLDRYPRSERAEAARVALDELSRLGPGRP